MFKADQPVTLAKLLVACGTLGASAAIPAAGDLVTFDNSEGQFVWQFRLDHPSDVPGNLLDLTRSPAEQSDADPALGFSYLFRESVSSSTEIVAHSIVGADDGMIARDSQAIIVHNQLHEATLHLATRFHAPIGPTENWRPDADTTWYSYSDGLHPMLGQTCTVGIRLNLADGVHYGYINLVWRPWSVDPPVPHSTGMYQPAYWGYDNEPDTPFMICDVDFNADGVANSQDFFDFLNLFFVSDPRADFNHSGTVDSTDFFTFLDAFFVGCS